MSAAQGRDGRAPLRDHRSKSPRHSLNPVTFPTLSSLSSDPPVRSTLSFSPLVTRHPRRGCYSRRRRHSRASRRRDLVPGCTRSCRSVAGICTLGTLSTRARTSRKQSIAIFSPRWDAYALRAHTRVTARTARKLTMTERRHRGHTRVESKGVPPGERVRATGRTRTTSRLSSVSRGGNKKKERSEGTRSARRGDTCVSRAMRLVAAASFTSVDPIDAPAMIGRDYPPNRRFFSTESSPPLGG